MTFIKEVDLIIIPTLIAIGYALKCAKFINDKYIPLILLGIGGILGAFNGHMIKSILEGIICASIAMGLFNSNKFNKV